MKESETETNTVDIVFECFKFFFKEIGSELSAIAIANANFRRRYNLESLKIMVFYAVIIGWVSLCDALPYTPPGRDLYCSPCRLYEPAYRSSPHKPPREVMCI